ncbi:hypothetical protein FS749_007617, partial [Ceratobasidium sp. UAMH 11750]
VSEAAIQELLERWAEHIERGAPEDFARLVQDLNPENISDRAGLILPNYYQVLCNVCKDHINNGFSCSECHDFDLCRDCYYGMKDPDVKQHEYEEFKIEEEITQIQRIMASLRRENITVACSRGGYVQCNKCQNVLSTPSSNFNTNPVYYYRCKNCDDFDVCLKCFPEEVSSPEHKDHVFGMIVATDDEATISRLSPTTSKLKTPQSPGTPNTRSFRRSPLPSPEPRAQTSPPSLFQSPSVFRTSSGSPLPPTTSRAQARRSLPARHSDYICDACHTPIESDEHWRCADPECTASSSIDLHLDHKDWQGGMHRYYHDMQLVPTWT